MAARDRRISTFALFLTLALLSGPGAAPAAADAWPQWRGPARDGQSQGPAWPNQLGTNHLQPLWQVELGPSYSGPIVGPDRVYTTETRDKKFEVVTALDRATGKVVWSEKWEGAMTVPFFAKANGDWIRATPALDGDRLFVAGMRDVLVCLDARSGKPLWRLDFVQDLKTPVPDFGFVCSPLVDGDSVYVQAGASVARVEKGTGRLVWRGLPDKGGMWGSVFSSPVIATLAGRRQLVVQTREHLAGLDLADGAVLWTQPVEAFRGMNILTPVIHQDLIFTSTYGGKTIGFQASAPGGKFTLTNAWTHKAQGYMSTPVLIEGVAYTHLRSQRLMAIELASGRERWTSDKGFGKYMSLVARGDRILALDQRGLLLLLRANPERFELLDQRKIAEAETWAHLAVTGSELHVRELNRLTAWRWQPPARSDL